MAISRSAKRILFAAGGSAGHIEPALAVADAIKSIDPTLSCEFIGTKKGLEQALIPKRGFQLHEITKVALPRSLSLAILSFPFRVLANVWMAAKIIRGANALIGFGGYVSAPAYLAASILRVPIVIHEANAKPGWANRLGRRFATTVAVNFPNVNLLWPGSLLTGMPIRSEICQLAAMSASEREKFREHNAKSWGFDPRIPIVAVFGGSQGSQHINSVIAEFIINNHPDIQLIHAVGMNNPLPAPRPKYLPLSYFHDMAAIYGSADLLITRSGAVTCAELMTVGRNAILIPLPHGNGEQVENARQLAESGLARLVDNDEFTAQWLNANLVNVITAANQGPSQSHNLNIDAANRIAELVLKAAKL